MDEQERPGYYAVIPADVRYDDSIPANAKLLYGEISALVGAGGFCYASNQYFADIYGMTEVSISRLFAKLEKAGYIRREAERDKEGHIIRRKIYLAVSVPEEHALYPSDATHLTKKLTGVNKKVKETNSNISSKDIDKEKENKKEKESGKAERCVRLENEQLLELCVSWIGSIAAEDWTRKGKNDLYLALSGFYEPRDARKKEPTRTKAAFTALTNRLVRYSGGSPTAMIDMLERATTAGWKSVYPLEGDGGVAAAPVAADRRDEEWL